MNATIEYYSQKLERLNRKIERIKRHEELSINEQITLYVAEAERRLVVEFLEDLNELK